ncbi:MAG: uncharacterized protein A8A55_0365 [Amphiamblys sp. WSBS2006]|nr:MAG: uncharacterized protein A8A55_0365 [Amphiamblys sp. WSBS2006]
MPQTDESRAFGCSKTDVFCGLRNTAACAQERKDRLKAITEGNIPSANNCGVSCSWCRRVFSFLDSRDTCAVCLNTFCRSRCGRKVLLSSDGAKTAPLCRLCWLLLFRNKTHTTVFAKRYAETERRKDALNEQINRFVAGRTAGLLASTELITSLKTLKISLEVVPETQRHRALLCSIETARKLFVAKSFSRIIKKHRHTAHMAGLDKKFLFFSEKKAVLCEKLKACSPYERPALQKIVRAIEENLRKTEQERGALVDETECRAGSLSDRGRLPRA